MTAIMKQRLIGSLLLLCVIAALAAFLMSKAQHDNEQTHSDEIHVEQSFISSIDVPQDIEYIDPEPETLVDPHNLDDVAIADKPESTQTIPAPADTDTSLSVSTDAWIIQLASFSKKQNAQTMQQNVSELGYAAVIETTRSANGELYRVRIGPEKNKSYAEKIIADIATKLKISPQLIKQK